MDFLLRLPEDLSLRFRAELEVIEEELNMPYVTSVERLARQEGLQEGRQEGLQEGRQEGLQEGRQEGRQEGILQGAKDLLRQSLEVLFGEVPTSLLEQIQQCQDVDVLRAFHKQVLTAGSLNELQLPGQWKAG